MFIYTLLIFQLVTFENRNHVAAVLAYSRACLKFGKISGCWYISLVETLALLDPCIGIETLTVDYFKLSGPE